MSNAQTADVIRLLLTADLSGLLECDFEMFSVSELRQLSTRLREMPSDKAAALRALIDRAASAQARA